MSCDTVITYIVEIPFTDTRIGQVSQESWPVVSSYQHPVVASYDDRKHVHTQTLMRTYYILIQAIGWNSISNPNLVTPS